MHLEEPRRLMHTSLLKLVTGINILGQKQRVVVICVKDIGAQASGQRPGRAAETRFAGHSLEK